MPVRSRSDLHVDQESAAVVVQRAEFVEVRVIAGRDDAAVAHLGPRFGGDGAHQKAQRGFRRFQFGK